jgi:hypothetical protein
MNSKLVESTFMLAGGLDVMTQEMAMLDAVLLAETIDHSNWKAIRALSAELPEGSIRTGFERAADEVEEQEDEHYHWAADTRARLTMLQAHAARPSMGEMAEGVIAMVKNWLSDEA